MQDRNAQIQAWLEAKRNAAYWKQQENDLRLALANDTTMFNPTVEKGTLNYTLGNGYGLKCVRKINTKVDNKDGKAFSLLSTLAARSEIVHHIAKELFNFDSPTIRQTKLDELKAADIEAYQMVMQLITETPATPELTFIEPKK